MRPPGCTRLGSYTPGPWHQEVSLREGRFRRRPGRSRGAGDAWRLAPDAEGDRPGRDHRGRWGLGWRLSPPSRARGKPAEGDDRLHPPIRGGVHRPDVRRRPLARRHRRAEIGAVLILVVIAASVLGVSALSHLKTATPDYREGMVSDERPLSLNPLVGATDQSVRDLGALLYRRLLRLDDRAVPVADLASSFGVSQDGLTYHLPLRSGQQWSDGRTVTVADVLATVAWVQSSGFGDAVTAAPWRDVHAQAVGDGVSFDLAGPRASFAAQLTQLPILPIGTMSRAAITALPKTAAVPMPTSGPFDVVSATPSTVTLFPNPHAAVTAHLNQVEIDLFGSFADAAAAYRAGTVDSVLASDPVQRAELVAAGGAGHNIKTFRFVDLLFNERGILADPAVREAIAAAIA